MQKEWWSQRGEAAERNKKQDYLSEVFFFEICCCCCWTLASLFGLLFFVGPCRHTHSHRRSLKELTSHALAQYNNGGPPINPHLQKPHCTTLTQKRVDLTQIQSDTRKEKRTSILKR